MNKAVANRASGLLAQLQEEIRQRSDELKAVLPREVRMDEFMSVTLNAINDNPHILRADRTSFFKAVTQCARDGLMPDGHEAYFDVRKRRLKNGDTIPMVVYIPMIGGLRKLIIGGDVVDWYGDVVREGDDYTVERGDNPSFRHYADPFAGSNGRIIGAYSIARFQDGSISREFMSLDELTKAKASSASAGSDFSPWNRWESRMYIKTVMKRHADRLPKNAKAGAVLAIEREIDANDAQLLIEPKRAPRKGRKPAQTKQLEDLGRNSNAENSEWNSDGGSTQNLQQPSRNAPSAEPAMDTKDGSQTNPENSKTTSDASQGQQKRGPGRPRKEETQAAAKQQPQQKQEPAQTGGGGDPIYEARQAGEAAYEAGIPRTNAPRDYQADDRWDELDAWLEGWDSQADDSAGRVMT